ncbi:PREDICTED: leukocyte elastase inhibitor A-like [Nicrophorus vespilloides]|uniref:Leukocyte elastase inhibitor A-like n=1 Tax=Nicrophorus vespilloides TaxID=110193 RepID=A0ABM1M026_NICVS|nr:PREDICTED: leukocyte elastase inhibitor A-like [Nicrophorus vespilloides]XP_017767927.1 PREDICTED: leukocyte elastase inhibitor A-like [Nicrophorus vespilloides]
MKFLLLLGLCCWIQAIRCQISFPEDDFTTSIYDVYMKHRETAHLDTSIARGVLNLTLELAKVVPLESEYMGLDNVVFSPLNIAEVLADVLLGANGKTHEELAQVLGFDGTRNGQMLHEKFGLLLRRISSVSQLGYGEDVKLASAIFLQKDYPIRPQYKSASERIYSSEVTAVDFKNGRKEAKKLIDNWVSEKTGGKIKDILEEVPPSDTEIIIAGALYFKAVWEHPFFSTKRRPFYTDGAKSKSTKMVEMMSNGGKFPYYKDMILNCEILGFPYLGNKSTMYVVKPIDSSKEKLQALQQRLTPEDVERMVSNTKYQTSVLQFPKMKLTSTLNLREALAKLGSSTLFHPLEADLSLISPGKDQKLDAGRSLDMNLDDVRKTLGPNDNPHLYADKVLHKVYMDITETGTEAAAATSVSLSRGGDIITFRVDVPFLFFIWNHETGLVLFWGAVYTPTPNF